jgi:5-hydroxyisourate hydrolase-like protein (transthyretin family)
MMISLHVIDVSRNLPAAGMKVDIFRLDDPAA